MGRKLGCLGDEGGARAQSRIESRWQVNGEGLGSLAAEPRSPAPKNVGDTSRVPWRKLANTRNPAGGFRLAVSGGIAAKLAMGQRGSGGVLSASPLGFFWNFKEIDNW